MVGVLVKLSPKPVGPAKPVPLPVGNRVVEFPPPKPVVPAEGVKSGRARRAMIARSGVASALWKQRKLRRVQQKVALIGAITPGSNALGQNSPNGFPSTQNSENHVIEGIPEVDSRDLESSSAEIVTAGPANFLYITVIQSTLFVTNLMVGHLLEARHSASQNADHDPGTMYKHACRLDRIVASIDQIANSNNGKRLFD